MDCARALHAGGDAQTNRRSQAAQPQIALRREIERGCALKPMTLLWNGEEIHLRCSGLPPAKSTQDWIKNL